MQRRIRMILGLSALLTLPAATASAQYYGGYGGYGGWGWGGWGGTVQGDIARGMGAYAQGIGQYNVETAQAASINTDTMMRWNSYVWASQNALNREHHARMLHERERNKANIDAIAKRISENPNDVDIARGDALNAILDQLSDPKIHPSALRLARIPVPADWIQAIPFRHASETITLSLHRLTSESEWPLALRGKEFDAERTAYEKAINAALEEDKAGDLKPETIQAVKDAIAALRRKVDTTLADKGGRDYIDAEHTLRALTGMAQMLQSPDVSKTLGALENYPGTTAADLMAFMHYYNLRFGASDTDAERQLYEKLYPLLDQLRDSVMQQTAAQVAAAPAPPAAGPPTQIFHDIPWNHLEGQPAPAAPGGNAPAPKR